MNQILYSYRNMGLGEAHPNHFPFCDLAIRKKFSELVILNTRLRPARRQRHLNETQEWQRLTSPPGKCSLEPSDLCPLPVMLLPLPRPTHKVVGVLSNHSKGLGKTRGNYNTRRKEF